MDKTKLALIKIEEAFGTITRRFDERMERVIRAEHTRINHMIAERRRKLAAKRKELIELGLPVRKSILNAEIRTTKAIFEVPEHIAATQDRSHLLAYVEDLENMKIHVEEYCKFLTALKESNNQILYDTAFELLPKAFTFSRKIFAYIDTLNGFIVVDSASAKSAEDLLSYLRKTLGSLPAQPLTTVEKPSAVMTTWLIDQASPSDINVEDECELRSPEEAGAIIRCKRHDLTLPEIKNHLDSGKQVIKLALNWDDRIAFVLDENLAIKRLRFLDLVNDLVADIEAEDEAARFDADFSIMSEEIANFLPRLLALFGGEKLS